MNVHRLNYIFVDIINYVLSPVDVTFLVRLLLQLSYVTHSVAVEVPRFGGHDNCLKLVANMSLVLIGHSHETNLS